MRYFLFLSGLLLLLLALLSARPAPQVATDPPTDKTGDVRLSDGQPAPAFTTTDVLGNNLSLEGLRGHITLLSFMRDAGCPVCELRLSHLALKADSLKKANTQVVLVYESDVTTMRSYLADKDLPFTFVADPTGELHKKYGVENSLGQVALGFVKGLNKQIKAGKKLQTQEISREDANKLRSTADFIIDEHLLVRRAYYGRYLGDHMVL